MNYAVEWEVDAENQLASIWLSAPDPDAVTKSQTEIDRRLSRNPQGYGRHRAEGLWRLDVPPLSATYVIDDVKRQVIVNGVLFSRP